MSRYPDPSGVAARRARMLADHEVDLVLDIGAAVGNYAAELRRHGYAGEIVSLEPLPRPFETLERRARSDPRWSVRNVAVGDEIGEVRVNIAGNSDSSSILSMLDAHLLAAPETAYRGSVVAAQTTVDEIMSEWPGRRAFLKIDVQGYEHAVLRGGARHMSGVVGLQVELSLVPLYADQLLMPELLDQIGSHGFELWGIEPGFSDARNGRLLQCDGVFFRGTDS